MLDPDDDDGGDERPTKRRRASGKGAGGAGRGGAVTAFAPLLGGRESSACVRLRQRLYEESWDYVNGRIQVWTSPSSRGGWLTRVSTPKSALRDSNAATLERVAAFVAAAESEW